MTCRQPDNCKSLTPGAKLCLECTGRRFEERNREIVSLWNAGHTSKHIGERFGLTAKAVGKVVSSARTAGRAEVAISGARTPGMIRAEKLRRRTVEMWNATTLNYREIARHLSVSPGYITHILRWADDQGTLTRPRRKRQERNERPKENPARPCRSGEVANPSSLTVKRGAGSARDEKPAFIPGTRSIPKETLDHCWRLKMRGIPHQHISQQTGISTEYLARLFAQ